MPSAPTVEVDVAFTPCEAVSWHAKVCIVIDELRASSTIVTLLDRGCAAVIPMAGVDEARQEARNHGYVLAGEDGGLRPAGYDYGNSPTELAGAELAGRIVVLRTQNGARVAGQLAGAPALLIGCLLNATACSAAALARSAGTGAAVGIVCAGLADAFALDDALAAGALVDRLCMAADNGRVGLTDAALAARSLWKGYRNPADGLRISASGRVLKRIGQGQDIDVCARVDASWAVPVLVAGLPSRFTLAAALDGPQEGAGNGTTTADRGSRHP
jgi:2-phosphosulfolactate phosphatase